MTFKCVFISGNLQVMWYLISDIHWLFIMFIIIPLMLWHLHFQRTELILFHLMNREQQDHWVQVGFLKEGLPSLVFWSAVEALHITCRVVYPLPITFHSNLLPRNLKTAICRDANLLVVNEGVYIINWNTYWNICVFWYSVEHGRIEQV